MGVSDFSLKATSFCVIFFLSHLSFTGVCFAAARNLFSLYKPLPMALKYHNGALLEGDLHFSILWYGKFSPTQKSIVMDFLLSLNHPQEKGIVHLSITTPSVPQWWQTVQSYVKKTGKKKTNLILTGHVSDEHYSMGRTLKKSQVSELTRRVNSKRGGLTLTIVLTADDVAVEGFCTSICGSHGSDPNRERVFIWVGNSMSQCPGRCAWPFHQPMYGPQTKTLVAPNGDVGIDGMVINLASLMAGTVTNPFGDGYYQGSSDAPLEAVSACPGIFGSGSYPGYAGELLMDPTTGGSYNAQAANGRKYLLPGLFDPSKNKCSTMV